MQGSCGEGRHASWHEPQALSGPTKIMRKDENPLTTIVCLLLSLTACGGEQPSAEDPSENPAPMTEEAYQAEVEAVSAAMGETLTAMSSLSPTDETSYREGIDAIREMLPPLRELAAIENPPEAYAEAHAQVAGGCTLFADAMDGLCDSELTAEDYNIAMTDYITDMTEAATQITEGLALIEQ